MALLAASAVLGGNCRGKGLYSISERLREPSEQPVHGGRLGAQVGTLSGGRGLFLRRSALWVGFVGALVLAAACGDDAATDGALMVAAPSPTPTAVPPSPTAVPSPTSTPAPTPTPTQTPIPGPPVRAAAPGQSVDLIAYTDRFGRVLVSDPDGAGTRRIDPDAGFYSWPSWSPSGDRIVFSGVPGKIDEPLRLYAYQLGDDFARVVFSNGPGGRPIYPNLPHYALWAPDGQRLALVASIDRRLTLLLSDLSYEDTMDAVFNLPEMYLSWSEDSQRLVVHGAGNHFIVDVGGRSVRRLGERAEGYRAPAWWPAGNRYTVVSEDPDGSRGLFVVDAANGSRTYMEAVPGEAAFLWSPDGQTLAVAQSSLQTGLVFQSLGLFRPDGRKMEIEVIETLVAFYWSPDSTKLAYVTLGDAPGVLRWKILDLRDGTRMSLADFIPSDPQLTQLEFFDQFAYSHTVWSPGSDALVFAGKLGTVGLTEEDDESDSRIIVARFEPEASVGAIAQGVMAFWSPR